MIETGTIATRFFDSIERGDAAAVRDAYGPDLKFFVHNSNGLVFSRQESIDALERFFATCHDRRYIDRQLDAFPGGFVQQHRLTCVRADGEKLAMDACVVGKIEAGKLVRLDEYCDAESVAKFRKLA